VIAIIYIIFFVIYIVVSIVVIKISINITNKWFGKGWLGAVLSIFLMYNIVFWDLLPVIINHERLCDSNSGLWIDVSSEQFIEENPDLARQVWDSTSERKWESKKLSNTHTVSKIWFNDSFYLERNYEFSYDHAISRIEQKLINDRHDQVLLRSVQFKRGDSRFPLSATGLTDYKFWLAFGSNECKLGSLSIEKNFKENLNKFIQQLGIKDDSL
jgi:hypothetical protein